MSATLALTMGEPGGVGGEIAVDAWRRLKTDGPTFFLIDDPARVRALARAAPIAVIDAPDAAPAAFPDALPVLDVGARVAATPGEANPDNAAAVVASIERAVALALGGEAAGVVTNPIQKSALIAAGFEFPGHTEFLAALVAAAPFPANRPRGPVMLLAGPDLRAAPVTIHQSVREAAAGLTAAAIERVGRVVADGLARDFGIAAPRLAVSGLNPHAGESGAMGREDADVIAPAVAALKAAGIDAVGPLPADTMFHAAARARYDAAICMLHDQALIPANTLAFDETVNVTLGLPIVRTSPAHGTALAIAGRGRARSDSLVAALRLAADIAARRA
ncbi:MAG: 4-hydroxythreonine-4-phosphate dehydrogenase PdxA [Parvularculaceae bacterium]